MIATLACCLAGIAVAMVLCALCRARACDEAERAARCYPFNPPAKEAPHGEEDRNR